MFLPSPPSPFTTLVGTVYRLFRENRSHGNTRNHRQRVDLEVYAQLISIIVLKIETNERLRENYRDIFFRYDCVRRNGNLNSD